jgi:hypothetical protein
MKKKSVFAHSSRREQRSTFDTLEGSLSMQAICKAILEESVVDIR